MLNKVSNSKCEKNIWIWIPLCPTIFDFQTPAGQNYAKSVLCITLQLQYTFWMLQYIFDQYDSEI